MNDILTNNLKCENIRTPDLNDIFPAGSRNNLYFCRDGVHISFVGSKLFAPTLQDQIATGTQANWDKRHWSDQWNNRGRFWLGYSGWQRR